MSRLFALGLKNSRHAVEKRRLKRYDAQSVSGLDTPRSTSRRIGRVAALALVAAAVLIFLASRQGRFHYRCFILAEAKDLRGLRVNDAVGFRGAEIGFVEQIKNGETGEAAFHLRLRVNCSAFDQIALDAGTRIEPSGRNGAYGVNILPGREKPPEDYPGKVKVLREESEGQSLLRTLGDVIEEVTEAAKSRGAEAELETLREENRRLREKIEELKGEEGDGP